jgi:hypothetical protein
MPAYCLICDSKAVLSKEAANVAVMLIGSIDRFLLSITQGLDCDSKTQNESLLMQLLDLIGESVSSATSGYAAMTAFAKDVHKYQFGPYDCLCLRCGARFDHGAGNETFSPTSDAQPSAQPVPQPSADPRDPTASATD